MRPPCDADRAAVRRGADVREHAACGVGFVADPAGRPSRRLLAVALEALARMEHRGGVGADGVSSDGAGVLTAIPWDLLAEGVEGVEGAGPAGNVAVGMLFLPVDVGKRRLARDLVGKAFEQEGLAVLGWREVPTDPSVLGPVAHAHRPHVEQILARSSTRSGDDLERVLLLTRRRIGAALQKQRVVRRLDDLYVCSLSCRTIVYKGMLSSNALPDYYADLRDPAYRSAFAVLHRRFSTNTLPKWSLAQPMRLLAHNGEINTLSGNLNWMTAREGDLAHPVWGERISDLLPVLHAQSSDSGALDKFIELLVRSGRSPLEAMLMTMPPALDDREMCVGGGPDSADAAVRDFFDYSAGVLEPWDGPALVAFSDGRVVGAAVDRNGLRPARVCVTASGCVAVTSEAGAARFGDDPVVERGRLGPGQLLAVDLLDGRVLYDDRIKALVAGQKPYGAWLRQARVSTPNAGARQRPSGVPGGTVEPRDHLGDCEGRAVEPVASELLSLQTAAGYTAEDVELVIRPMAQTGREPRFSMGDDAPLPVLSGQLHTLYDYFTQRFAQVTNPPIDPLRERLVMSLEVRLGGSGNLLDAGPEHARRLVIPSPLLDEEDLAALRSCDLRSAAVSTHFAVADGPWGLRAAVDRLSGEAAEAVRAGAEVLILSDRLTPVDARYAAIPPLLAVGAVHHRLIRDGLRGRASLVAETAQCWTSHHFACLIGYGASAVAPYLALATVRALAPSRPADSVTPPETSAAPPSRAAAPVSDRAPPPSETTYRASVDYGLRKVLSRMGISLLAGYHGAQLFEAVGIGPDLIELGFPGTPSRIGGLSVEELAEETIWLHQRAFPELTVEKLQNYGFVRFRRSGEYHLNNPEAAKTLRRACVEGSYELFEEYIARMIARPPTVLRDLLDTCSDRRPIDFHDTEPAEAVTARFVTGGMSLGALSREAHETLAVAMNRLGGKANSGEGGEDPERFRPLDDVDENGRSARLPHLRGLRPGDSARTAIKQVASGRFGVTTAYLVNAEELEIKVAQGAKPGEGGELPAAKVTAYIAALRRARPGRALISPPPHHDIYSIEDLAQLIADLRAVNPVAAITVKLVAGHGIGTIAAGVAKAGADVIHVSGSSGGTAAASLNSIKHAGIPWELGLLDTHRALRRAGLRERVRLRVDGGLRTGRDVLLATLLGADEMAFGTSALIAEGCVMARACHLDRCPAGIASQQEALRERFAGEPEHVVNYFLLVARRVRTLLARLGYRSLAELVGRTDLLRPALEVRPAKTAGLDWDWLLTGDADREAMLWADRDLSAGGAGAGLAPTGNTALGRRPASATSAAAGRGDSLPSPPPVRPAGMRANGRSSLDRRLLDDTEMLHAVAEHGHVTRRASIDNADRSVGAGLAGEIARRHGDGGFRGSVRLDLAGVAGQSFGAFLVDGLHLTLTGEANDYIGKGMAGGEIVIRPPRTPAVGFANVIAGNTCLYGATGGRLFVAGAAGERLAVRNSAAAAVVEGAGDHACEYMTGGLVLILGPMGRNACAGMTGGTLCVLDPDPVERWLNPASVRTTNLSEPGLSELRDQARELLTAHVERTASPIAQALLDDWPVAVARFICVTARV